MNHHDLDDDELLVRLICAYAAGTIDLRADPRALVAHLIECAIRTRDALRPHLRGHEASQ